MLYFVHVLQVKRHHANDSNIEKKINGKTKKNPIQIWKAVHGKPPTRDGIIIYPVLLKPRSRGTIRLQSADPADDPLINPNYLAEDADAKILVEGQYMYYFTTKRLHEQYRVSSGHYRWLYCPLVPEIIIKFSVMPSGIKLRFSHELLHQFS